jgi:hypothetical protein
MFRKKNERATVEELYQIGRSVLWSAAASNDEADKVAGSPFLFTRIAARIDEEQRRRSAIDTGWLLALSEAKRALAALALVAIAAFGLLWFSTGSGPQKTRQARNDAMEIRPVSVSACSLASADECAISNNDVLATMFAEGGAQE